MSQKTLLLIDSYALIYRAYYAFPPTLTSEDGKPINAVYGFASLLLDVILKFNPSNVIALMDSASPTIRSSDFTQYKANRKPPEESLVVQFPRVNELLEKFNIPILSVDGYEADDMIATIDQQYAGKWGRTIIVTGDRDLFQLVDEDTFVYLAGSSFSQSKLYTSEMVLEKIGVTPEQIPDFKGLNGDTSDNIPGVAGIGEKSAVDLIKTYGSLEKIYQSIDHVPSRYQNKLRENYEIAVMSKNLATVVRNVPINFDFESSKFPNYKASKLKNTFEILRFKSLESKLNKLFSAYPEVSVDEQVSLLDNDNTSNISIWNEEDLKNEEITLLPKFSIGLNFRSVKLESLRILHNEIEYLIDTNNFKILANLFKNNHVYTYELKKWIHLFLNNDLSIKSENIDDLVIKSIIFSSGEANYSLPKTYEYFSRIIKISDKSEIGKLFAISKYLKGEFKQDKLYEIEKKVVEVVVDMEREGISLDESKLKIYLSQIHTLIDDIKNKIFTAVGNEFNLNSPKQLGEILFTQRKLVPLRKTKGGSFSTNESALQLLIGQDPVVDLILSYRSLEKIRSTYLESLGEYKDSESSKIHSTFDQFGAISGRFSSKNPNMQNMPKDTLEDINIRDLFVSSEGKVFIGVDYSQQELRILAALSQEETMLDAFNQGGDIHVITAAELFGIDIQEVTKAQRGVGKTINFSVIYGISPFALSERLKIPRDVAGEFINKYYKRYPQIKKFMDDSLNQARKDGFTETILGRKRIETSINSPNKILRAAAERELFNFIIQGSAADLMKMCMVRFPEVIGKYSANLLLQVHDEFLFEISESQDLKSFVTDIQKVMLNVKDIGVKYDVDVKYGRRWGSMSEFTF